MENKAYFFAVDLGATSGRTIIGSLANGRLEQEEITRFPNNLIETGGHFYWDIYALYFEMIRGLKEVACRGLTITSIGIDTWGVDFVFIGDDGAILRNPMAYRDPHTFEAMDDYLCHVVQRQEVYDITGIQFMNFNSLFQLHAMRKADNTAMKHCQKVLFVPDALSWMLTGEAVCEYTIASTSQMLDPRTGDLSEKLIESVGLTRNHFGRMVQPGTQIGVLTEEVQKMTGLGPVPVIAVAGHDTGAAVAAVPAKNEQFAYLSSGTWSLMGIETKEAIINDRSYELNFTNEGGIEGTTRFLKNICGMWLYERCRKEWISKGERLEVRGESIPLSDVSHPELQGSAMQVEAFRSIINPDDAAFANPPSMIEAIQTYCRATGQAVPETPAEICRCIFDSLALRYRQVFGWLNEFWNSTAEPSSTEPATGISVLHVIGGGSLNKYLTQFTADACGVEVLAGPQECTAIGNIMLQAKAMGLVKDVWEMRAIIAASVDMVPYHPAGDKAAWDAAYEKYLTITNQK
jgi:rhamnulokinase